MAMPRKKIDTTDADIILRSADGREFRAHKIILSLVSSVFRDMFSLPQSPRPQLTSVPIVDVSEAGETIEAFLQCIYPVSNPILTDFDLLEGLAAASDKYEAEIVLETVKSCLVAHKMLAKDPFRVYAIACRSPPLEEIARSAAGRMTLDILIRADSDAIARLSAMNYHRLVVYLVRRAEGVKSISDHPSIQTIFAAIRCDCRSQTQTVPENKEEIKKAITDAFVSNPSLSVNKAVALAFKQLPKVRLCMPNESCCLVTRREEYAKKLRELLIEFSDEMWRSLLDDKKGA